MAIFQNYLLNKKLKGEPQKWKIEGLFDTKLSLTLPLQDSHDSSLTNIEINTAIINSQFSLPQQPAITNVNGMIHYSSKTGFKAKNIQGELLNHPVNISVKNEMLQGKNRITYILCKGQADFNRLKPFIPDNLSKFIEGDMNYEVRLGIPESGDYFIDLKSNLKGLTIDMPDKFKTSKEQEQPFYLLLTPFEHNKLNLYIEYGKLLYTTLCIRNKQIAFGSVILNPNKNSATDAVFKKGITFSGVIDEVNLNNWIEWLKKYQLLTTSTPVHLPLLAKKLVINSIKFKDYTLGKINLNSEIKNDKIISSFDSREIKGFVVQSEDHKDQPLSIVLKELNLPDNTLQKYTQLSLQKNQINHINPSIFPALQLSVEQIHIGDQYYGKVKFNLEPQAHTIILRQLNALLGNLQIDGTLTWENIGKSQQTSTFEGKLETENLNTMFKKWHYSQTNFHAKFAKVITHLTWSGTPFDFNLVQSTGEVSALVRNGNITGTSDIDKLHIFGLLNINTITKRLRLDFSDLFDSGISFDKIKGSASFKEGLITLNAPVIIDGPSSNFALYGTINIPKKYVDLNMDVSLPIAQNLPTISLLLGQPALAGAIYLFDKLVGKKIMKFSTLRYNIKGQVDNPVVTADKSFADQFKKVKNTATINKNKTTH
ncbi:MAG: hypothetical protein OXD32_00680 [Endozoicomonadaceae bacterium]|nr:hypothetical protein [Endozoicomonadaceae bacterium]